MTAPATLTSAKAGAAPSYEVKIAQPDAKRDEVFSIWSEGGLLQTRAPEVTRQRYDWFYIQNPQGKACLNLLYGSDGALVGSLGIGARQMFVDGTTYRAGVLVDFVVSPKHRSVLPALTLQRKARAHALESMGLLYGLPSPKAASICRRLETQVAFDIPRFARVLHYRSFLTRLMPGWLATPGSWALDALDRVRIGARLLLAKTRAEWMSDFDGSFDALWSAVDKTGQCLGLRDQQFLRWRFRGRPGRKYDILAIRSRRDGSLRAYFVCDRSESTTFSVADCLCLGSEDEIVQHLMQLALAARKLGAPSVDIRISAGSTFVRALQRAGFRERASQAFFVVMDPALAARVAGHTWYITKADEDV